MAIKQYDECESKNNVIKEIFLQKKIKIQHINGGREIPGQLRCPWVSHSPLTSCTGKNLRSKSGYEHEAQVIKENVRKGEKYMQKKKKGKSLKSVWKTRNIKVVFSEPDIQESSSVVYVKDMSEFMYYYYIMTVYKYTGKKWRKELVAFAYDFPGILSAKLIIEKLLQSDYHDGSWQFDRSEEWYGDHNTVWYKKSYGTEDIMNEDYYRIERTIRITNGEEFEDFSLTIGSGTEDGEDGFSNTVKSVTINFLKRSDIESFLKTAEEFIQMSIDDFNNKQEKHLALERAAREVKNGKLYEYRNVYDNEPDNIDDIYITGDIIDFTILDKNEGKDVFTEFHNCVIKDVEKSNIGMAGYIVVTDGYKNNNHGYGIEKLAGRTIKIPVELITYIFDDRSSSEKLKYNKKQCKNDFMSIMSPEEKEEFAKKPLKKLTARWLYAVAGRTWMFREEHGFKDSEKAIKWVIKQIQKECRAENKKNNPR